ncbi:MAG: DUF3891 family protein [Pirellulales bacterium]
MIRRNLPLGFEPREWLLISQIEHARISRLLAEHWGSDEVQPVVCRPDENDAAKLQIRREVLAGIARHDDGWASWEAAPQLDLALGRPLDFMEMPQADSLRIWEESIRAARNEGLLAGAMTAGHFLALLTSSHHQLTPAAIEWRTEIERRRDQWLREWRELNPAVHSGELTDQALRWLQAFDWLSLWLCCKCPASPVDLPGLEPPLELRAHSPASDPIVFLFVASGQELFVTAKPWPFDTRELNMVVSCEAVPAAVYRSTHEFMACRRTAQLEWRLVEIAGK